MSKLPVGAFVTKNTNALFQFHFDKCNIKAEVYTDLEQFSASTHDLKISCIQFPYPIDPGFESTINNLLNCSDRVLVLASELHDRTVEVFRKVDNPRVSYFICGELNQPLTHSPVHKLYDWFTTSTHFYKHVRPSTLDTLRPYEPKPYYFDALLGRKKLHRDFAFEHISKNENIVTYINDITCDFRDPAKWIWESNGTNNTPDINWTVDYTTYYGHKMCVSQIIPLDIYNKTAYSLVAETNYSNHYNFYTEKTVKPILGRRLFVMLSGQHQLHNLRQLGFQTFDGILDESYDTVEDNIKRFEAVLDQVRFLSTQPQEEILAKIKPICDHNFNVMINVDWYGMFFRPAFAGYFNQ